VTSPQSNGMAESFVKTFKRDYAKLANRPDSQTVMSQLKAWFDDYNSCQPNSVNWQFVTKTVQGEMTCKLKKLNNFLYF
jgi:transposase InsO family protein